MLEITPDDIAVLNDADLRTLVALLCEAELRGRGLSTAAVTWGGSQTAADGGLDVRVALTPNTMVQGFVPRAATGFQVKKPDMPRREILLEMKPSGKLRPVIRELAEAAGAYIIVSANGSTADVALRNRREAMAEAVQGLPNAADLLLDFYDRTRIATWVRNHPGVILWARERIGKAVPGWQPYGPWAYAPDGRTGDYLVDDALRIRISKSDDSDELSAAAGIERIRDAVRKPRSVVRLVGLSGVGKTRLVQALFDERVGARSLDPSLTIYTNLSDNPNPQPQGLACDLVATQTRAILIVDNCPPDLHHRLSEVARAEYSCLSVITVEFDVRDDQPEGTDVFSLEPSSVALMEKLLSRRFPEVSQVDRRTVAEFSGGNARMAIALAETIGKGETIAGLTNTELFRRLFEQRHAANDSLLRIAQACSLVYSFEGETLEDDAAELPTLAGLAGTNVDELFRGVAELRRRNLVQQRGIWRAILPHGIANRLAETALENIPYSRIEDTLVCGSERLLRSFSRRLGYLGGSKEAVAIVTQWLGSDGILKEFSKLNDLGRTILQNVAPVAPLAVLEGLERWAARSDEVTKLAQSTLLVRLVRSIAYDAGLFDRAAKLLVLLAETEDEESRKNDATKVFESLFTIHLSGTHATIEQRLAIIGSLLHSNGERQQRLGLDALDSVLEAWHFSSHYAFEFGARSRDFGYQPRTQADVTHWFGSALRFIEPLTYQEGPLARGVRAVLAQVFRGLWTRAHMYDELERICRGIAKNGFWREGWIAIRQTRQFDAKGMPPEIAERLAALDAEIRPSNLVDRIRTIVFSKRGGSLNLDLDDLDEEEPTDYSAAFARMDTVVEDLGRAAADDSEVFGALLPELVGGEGKLWGFGRGLAQGTCEPKSLWSALTRQLAATPRDQQNIQVLCGILAALNQQDTALVSRLLDEAVTDPTLSIWLPVLQIAVPVDPKGVARLKQALTLGNAPIGMYRPLQMGRSADPIAGPDLKDLLLTIGGKEGGYDIAVEILAMRLHSYHLDKIDPPTAVVETGQELLRRLDFSAPHSREDHNLKAIARACLKNEAGSGVAGEICRKLMEDTASYNARAYDQHELITALLGLQPMAVLNALFSGDAKSRRSGCQIVADIARLEKNPLAAIPDDILIQWCEGEPSLRYPLAASVIAPFSPGVPVQWTSAARRLLKQAPDRLAVFKELVDNFQPSSWSGSLATLMEARLPLLDDPEIAHDPLLGPAADERRAELRHMVENHRRYERERDKERDERFE